MESDFAEWILEFEHNVSYLTDIDISFDWERFHKWGLTLARRLKAELGSEVRVRYIKPGEDPGSDIDTCTEIFLDFDPPKSATVPLELHELPFEYSPKEKELAYIDIAGDSRAMAILCYFFALAGNTGSTGFILNRISDDITFNSDHLCVQGKDGFTDYFREWHGSNHDYIQYCYELGTNRDNGGLCVIEHTKHKITDCGIGKQTRWLDIEADLNGAFKVISVVTIDETTTAVIGAGLFPGIEDEYIQRQLSYKPKSVIINAGYEYPCCVHDENGSWDAITEFFCEMPDVVEIDVAFQKWADWYGELKHDMAVFPWEAFNRQGLALSKRLYQAIKHTGYEVSYWKSCQEPGTDPFQKIAVSDE